uniref:hypothetical protein n=1 Tax=Segatella hominis TaxID=2518605 RepID=UPI004024D6CA
MKKRFTLMMMVMCFLMSIPLKMMADKVIVHYINEKGWADVYAYVYKYRGDHIGALWHGTKCNDIKSVGEKKWLRGNSIWVTLQQLMPALSLMMVLTPKPLKMVFL